MKTIVVLLIVAMGLTACGRKGDPEPPALTQAQ
jgi:predicted small lipoprotein YifL